MKKLLILLLFAAFIFFPSIAFAKIKVVATLPTLGALAREIGGDDVSVEILSSPNQDPHFVDARPDYILKANKADLLIYNGMELEIGWLPPIQKSARNPKILEGAEGALDASRAIHALEVPKTKIDRSQGDIHAQGNPHYLYSLEEVLIVAKAVSEKLQNLDSANADKYKNRYESFQKAATIQINAAKEQFSHLPEAQKSVVTYHASMPYLIQWLGLNHFATIEPKPGIAPGPAHVAKLVSQMKSQKPAYIIQEPWQPRSTSEQIAKMTGAKLVILPVFPENDEKLLDFYKRMLACF